MVNVLVKGIIHVIVEKLLTDELEHFLVVLPILQLSLLYIVLRVVVLVFHQVNAAGHNLKYKLYNREAIKLDLVRRVLTHVQQVEHQVVLYLDIVRLEVSEYSLIDVIDPFAEIQDGDQTEEAASRLVSGVTAFGRVDEILPEVEAISEADCLRDILLEVLIIEVELIVLLWSKPCRHIDEMHPQTCKGVVR